MNAFESLFDVQDMLDCSAVNDCIKPSDQGRRNGIVEIMDDIGSFKPIGVQRLDLLGSQKRPERVRVMIGSFQVRQNYILCMFCEQPFGGYALWVRDVTGYMQTLPAKLQKTTRETSLVTETEVQDWDIDAHFLNLS